MKMYGNLRSLGLIKSFYYVLFGGLGFGDEWIFVLVNFVVFL